MIYAFAEFELDVSLYELRRNGKPSKIEPQVFDVLLYLIRNRDRLVTKDQLLDEVWGTHFITEATLSSRLMAARKALGDTGQNQRYIQTVRGRGYRFLAPVKERETGVAHQPALQESVTVEIPLESAPALQGMVPVGRASELQRLREHLQKAAAGSRQVVFLTGKAGAGKTTLTGTFLQSAATGRLRVACGQCLDQHGYGEAYMPLLEALDRLCRRPDDGEIIERLKQYAPTWLAQMPWLLTPEDSAALEARVLGQTRERMLREMVQLLETLSQHQPLLLILEDAHWSDQPTLDLLSLLARRTEAAQLLVLCTYRPSDVGTGHPLRRLTQELRIRGHCSEVALPSLSGEEVGQYLAARFPGAVFSDEVIHAVQQRTAGNPLYLRTLTDSWVTRCLVAEEGDGWVLQANPQQFVDDMPEDLRDLIAQQLALLEPVDQDMLRAASVAGAEFSASVLAALTSQSEEEIEARLLTLARLGRFIEEKPVACGPWVGNAAVFGFTHHLYQEALYLEIAASRRARLHREIGTALENIAGERAPEIASLLSDHFLKAHHPRAAHYLQITAQQALNRSAYRESVVYLEKALEVLLKQPETEERQKQELQLRLMHAPSLAISRGWLTRGVEEGFSRAMELCRCLNDTESYSGAVQGMGVLYEIRGYYPEAEVLMNERLALLKKLGKETRHIDRDSWAETHELMACSLFHQGKFSRAIEHCEHSLGYYDPQNPSPLHASLGEDIAIACEAWSALSLWFMGEPDEALSRAQHALAMARLPGREYCTSTALTLMGMIHQLRGEVNEVLGYAAETVDIAIAKGFPQRIGTGKVLHGWALAMSGQYEQGVQRLQEGVDVCRKMGYMLEEPYFLALLAECHMQAGHYDLSRTAMDQALLFIEQSRSYFYEAELYRLEAEWLRHTQPKKKSLAKKALEKSIAIAREQDARMLEMRSLQEMAALAG